MNTAIPQQPNANPDEDALETREWLDALESVLANAGPERANQILSQLAQRLVQEGVPPAYNLTTPFRNTISVAEEKRMPGDLFMERRVRSLVRWNALAMVVRANRAEGDVGGHISSFSSAATLYDVGFNYFFRGDTEQQKGDLIFFQGHSSPGIYARSFLEGRLSEENLDGYRRELSANGIASYPHPWLMPNYWQFATVSMGLGPIQGIYQAHIMRYLSARSLIESKDRKVWVFCGDGEMDEPESLGAISMAGREGLDNLIFVVNCNLQRLDGPVRGNGKIIQELEGVFRGAGWNVIKVVWGRLWDPLFQRDKQGFMQTRMDEVCDGDLQNYKAKDGAYVREHFFGKSPELASIVEDLTDMDIERLNRGGHDPYKVYAAYSRAVQQANGKPTVILAHTVKGYGIGSREADNTTHQVKNLDVENLRVFRDRFDIPIPDEKLEEVPYYRPPSDSAEVRHLKEVRSRLGGQLPARNPSLEALTLPADEIFTAFMEGSNDRSISTTMALVRLMTRLIGDKEMGKRVVPVVPDEARTFGMEGMFRGLGIYSSQGQRYEPEDAGQLMYYRESKQGVILEEGLTEAGAFSAWLGLATSYVNHGPMMVPFYLFYSMFGFQRVHDLCWAAGDMQARGFLIGATSGRTTLNGEGLQHQDGHSHILADTIPNCVSYDPAFAGELAVIVRHAYKRMYVNDESVYHYITVMNENYPQPALISGSEEGITRGMYLFRDCPQGKAPDVRLLGSGAIMGEVLAAADMLEKEHGLAVRIYSVTSYTELRRDGLQARRWQRLHPGMPSEPCWVEKTLADSQAPVVAASDYMQALPDGIREWVKAHYSVLGTDGYGRSDTREALRSFFEIDRHHITATALSAQVRAGKMDAEAARSAIQALPGVAKAVDSAPPWTR